MSKPFEETIWAKLRAAVFKAKKARIPVPSLIPGGMLRDYEAMKAETDALLEESRRLSEQLDYLEQTIDRYGRKPPKADPRLKDRI